MSSGDLFELTAHITAIFERLGVPYMVGGSLGSSTYGTPRLTQDVDMVADLPAAKAEEFVANLGPEYYCDSKAIVEAAKSRRSFNILQLRAAGNSMYS